MHDSPSPPLPARVLVVPSTGQPVEGRLLAWERAPDGSWAARVEATLTVPAEGVTPLPGADYTGVRRVSAAPPAPALAEPPAAPSAPVPAAAPAPADPGWVIAAVGRTAGDREVHRTDRCWMDLVAVRPATEQEALAAIEAGTPACTVCRPEQP